MKIPVVYLSFDTDVPPNDYWDHGMLNGLLRGGLWSPLGGYDFTYHEMYVPNHQQLPTSADGCIIVLPARRQTAYIDRLNDAIKKLKWCVIMLTGDEECEFPYEQIKHPNCKIWVMSPKPGRGEGIRHIGTGYHPRWRSYMVATESMTRAQERKFDWFFAGQITHERREAMAKELEIMLNGIDGIPPSPLKGKLIKTTGFTQGVPPYTYSQYMVDSKVAICPSGPVTPDSFRLFEALESGCIPIADTRTPKGDFPDDYWTFFFGEQPPFPVLTDYEQLPGYINEAVSNYPRLSNKIFAWWQAKKRQMAYDLKNDIETLSGVKAGTTRQEQITVVVPTSPVPSNPSTKMIETTIASIRKHLPLSEIIITFDGVRPEQEGRRAAYEAYTARVLWLCNTQWHNVLPIVFEEHQHQARMLRATLPHVITSCILYVEHDAPLVEERTIPFAAIVSNIESGKANLVRLHHEAYILPDHKHLMLDTDPQKHIGMDMLRTAQWSQRPHVASVAFYEHLLEVYFHPDSKTMIEDVMHGIVETAFREKGVMGWYNFRLWIYAPPFGGSMQRSYHLDGREDDPKYDMDIKEVSRGSN